jgi:hypothetical protein
MRVTSSDVRSVAVIRLFSTAVLVLTVAACGNATPQASNPVGIRPSAPANIYISKDFAADKPGMQIVEVYGRLCLERFPTRAVNDGETLPIVELPPEQVRRFLHDDPGHAYRLDADGGSYIVTVEDPPFLTCAVRRLYATPPKAQGGFSLLTQAWAIHHNLGPLVFLPPIQMDRGGLQIQGERIGVPPSGQSPAQQLMNLTTHNPDGSTETRLVRQIMTNGGR